jgi:urease accessory protein
VEPVAIRLTRRIAAAERIDAVLHLTCEQRARSRLRARLDDGREVGILLARGECVSSRDLLASEDGTVVEVRAADEPVSTARCDDPSLIARAAYHLGNRHVALEIRPGRLRWLRDHVLDAMVQGLGLAVVSEQAPFEPEPGAYGAVAGHGGGPGHGHAH